LVVWAIIIWPDSTGAAGPALSRQIVCQTIADAATANELPMGFLARLLWTESGFRSSVISPAGAIGVAQFMPQTAVEQGLSDPRDPFEAIYHSARMLFELNRRFGNLGLAAAAYNAGSGRVTKWLQGQSRLPIETEMYVLSITGRHAEEWAAMRGSLADGSFSPPSLDCFNLGMTQLTQAGSAPKPAGWQLRLDLRLANTIRLSTELLHIDLLDPPSSKVSARAQTKSLCAAFRASGIACQVFDR
jgi:hypothetical protein